jgi:AraC family transcriptional regulator
MNSALTIQKYLALNQGRYLRETVNLPQVKSNIYVTTHLETAATDLPHYHETTHFSFLLNGGATDKRKNSEAEKISGELMFFHSGEIHQSIYKSFPVKNINIELEDGFFRNNSIVESDFKSSVEQNANAKFRILKIYKELLTNDEFSDSSIEMILLSLLEDKPEHKNFRPKWLDTVLEVLNDNWNDEISVGSLALAANVHPKTISKYFPKYFACTLGEYRRKIKVEKSLSLIKTSNLSLTEIAYECGFYDQSHFTATFKQMTGFRPKEFQKI